MSTLEIALTVVSTAVTAWGSWSEYKRRKAVRELLVAEAAAEEAAKSARILNVLLKARDMELQNARKKLAEKLSSTELADRLTVVFGGKDSDNR